MTPSIKQIVKDNMTRFSFYRTGNMFYTVDVEGQKYQFPVSLEDIGGATLTAEFKAIAHALHSQGADGRNVCASQLMWQADPV